MSARAPRGSRFCLDVATEPIKPRDDTRPVRGDGTFQSRIQYPVPDNVNDVTLQDFNGDGILDLAALSSSSQGILSIRLGSGGGAFGPERRFGAGGSAGHLTPRDLDGDGIPDA